MSIYTISELKEKIKQIDLKLEQAQSQVTFNGRSVSFQVNELTKQRDYYQKLLSSALKKKGGGGGFKYANIGGRF